MKMSSNLMGLCSICQEQIHRYTCPRCNINYCSLKCYKDDKHADCSEKFYKEWFVKEMKERKVTDAEKQLLIELIHKTEHENPIIDFLEDVEEEVSLEERMQGLNIQDLKDDQLEELWSRLNPQEQEEFRNLTKSGIMSFDNSSTEAWTPFWLSHDSSLVAEINEGSLDEKHLNLPSILTVPSLQEMVLKKPFSPLIGFNLINILYPYVFFQRLYNGCGSSDFPLDFCDACVSSSTVLKENHTFSDADESICCSLQSSEHTARKQSLKFEMQFSIECIQDVSHVLMGPNPQSVHSYSCCCLSDLHAVCTKSKKSQSGNTQRNFAPGNIKEMRKLLFRIMKKLEFFVAWSSQFQEQLALLAIEVAELYKKKIGEFKVNAAVEIKETHHHAVDTNKTKKPLIVELI